MGVALLRRTALLFTNGALIARIWGAKYDPFSRVSGNSVAISICLNGHKDVCPAP